MKHFDDNDENRFENCNANIIRTVEVKVDFTCSSIAINQSTYF